MLLEVRLDRLVPQMNNIIDYMLLRTQVGLVHTNIVGRSISMTNPFPHSFGLVFVVVAVRRERIEEFHCWRGRVKEKGKEELRRFSGAMQCTDQYFRTLMREYLWKLVSSGCPLPSSLFVQRPFNHICPGKGRHQYLSAPRSERCLAS